MKKILFAISMLVMTVPSFSFANEANENIGNLPATDEMNEATSEDATADHWRRPRFRYTCVATNFRRQRFVGRDWNLNRARNEALRSCNRRSFLRCWVQSCYRSRW